MTDGVAVAAAAHESLCPAEDLVLTAQEIAKQVGRSTATREEVRKLYELS